MDLHLLPKMVALRNQPMKFLMNKKLFTIAVMALGLCLGKVNATTVDERLNFDLNAFKQGPTTTNGTLVEEHIVLFHVNSEVLANFIAEDVDTNFLGGHIVLRLQNFGTTNETEAFIIRKGTNELDVTSNFSVVSQDSVIVSQSRTNAATPGHFVKRQMHTVDVTTVNRAFHWVGFATLEGRRITHGTGGNAVTGEVTHFQAEVVGSFSKTKDGITTTGPLRGHIETGVPAFHD